MTNFHKNMNITLSISVNLSLNLNDIAVIAKDSKNKG